MTQAKTPAKTQAMTQAKTLALAIPVHDDAAALARLLECAERLAIFDQVVICDDGSPAPVTRDLAPPALRPRIEILRNDSPRGAGQARNRTLGAVACSHLMFFDSDDLPGAELAPLWHGLSGETFDFCLFRHHDTRSELHGGWGQMPGDDRLWRRAGMGGRALAGITGQARLALAETANYPWNKIYRTGFLRAHGLGCVETEVHEDVELHWRSFLYARRILASDRIAATHVVRAGGSRLSNRRDAARLAAFASFSKVADEIAAAPDPGLQVAYLRFIAGLSTWMRAHLDPALHDRLDADMRTFLRRHVTRDVLAALAGGDPSLAAGVLAQMGAAPGAEETPAALLAHYDGLAPA